MDTIKSSADISHLFSTGRRQKTPYLTLIIGEGPKEASRHDRPGRVAFIAGKKLGNAVWRNAAKRRMREVCRALGGPWPGYDVIFLAKSSLTDASYSKVLKACDKAVAGSCLGEAEEGRG
ncbi:ribonuclease P protein component [Adlercreutzia faecimuris]|uniref:Ribonuclease P protein component n=1 Tax=Adlercreutzia faecimuris TaxID=2897341 RepID=A0ABS9WDP8_9ACTN|nr:ribonuclease P protein component [Adlercreutzia sp. JBNU-10]MCI2240905.1 ribonuclease P protein component [Adlercreutzia sp. JBNU-10]